MLGVEVPLLEQGAVQFMLLTLMLIIVSVIIWITIAK
jgi:hypothetical protein